MPSRAIPLLRLGPPLAAALLTGPILFGLFGTVLPAFGYLPALGGHSLSLAPMRALLAEPGLWNSAGIALATGLAATAASLGLVLLFVGGWAGTPVFARVVHLVSPLLAVPHAAAAFGLAFLIAPSGFLARLVSPELTGWTRPPDLLIVNDPGGVALIAGLFVKEAPFLLLIALASLPHVDFVRTRAICSALGYGQMAGFVFGIWPRLYRQMRLAVFAVLAFSTSVVDVAVILGPGAPPPLAVQLARWMQDPDLAMRFVASAGALLQLAVAAAALLLWLLLERAGAWIRDRLASGGKRFRSDGWLLAFGLAATAVLGVVTFAGLGLLALWSVAGQWPFPDILPADLTGDIWARALTRAAHLLARTFAVAFCATVVAIVLVILCLAREEETGKDGGRWAQIVIYLPLMVPQTAFLFGLQWLFLVAGLSASFIALVLVHLVFVMPYVFLSLADPWRAFDRRYETIAIGLGKRRSVALLKVRLPMMIRAILTAGAVGFAVSVGLYLPTLLIGVGRIETITTEAVALAAGGNRRVIGVYAFLQMLLPAAGFLVAIVVPALIFRHRRAGSER